MNKLAMYDVILAPVVTEKSTRVSEHNQVVFKVAQGRHQAARSRRRSRACSASR